MTDQTITLNAAGVGNFQKKYPASSPAVNYVTARCYQHSADGPWKVVTLIADSKWQSLLMAGDDDEMFMTRSLNVTPKTTEQHLIARSE